MTWVLLAVMISSTVLGDVLQSYEMKQAGAQTLGARGLMALLQKIGTRIYLLLAIFFMAVSFFAFMALLQRAPMSFAVPASAATLIVETVLAKFFLREQIGTYRWVGTFLVSAGVVLLAH